MEVNKSYFIIIFKMSDISKLILKNKSHQIMLHNANLASNLRWLYTEGSVDEEEWEKYSSSPGAMLRRSNNLSVASFKKTVR